MKYLLDTCIVSEMAKKAPDSKVAKWLGSQRIENLYLSWLTIGELRYVGRIFVVEREVAVEWGRICGEAERIGKPRPAVDALIAATAVVHKMKLATRNVCDMEGMGADIINPFE